MKWIAAILLVINVLVFLEYSNHQAVTQNGPEDFQPGEIYPDVNLDSMQLLHERYPDGQEPSEGKTAPSDAVDRTATIIPDKKETHADTEGSATRFSEQSCYRVGPFREEHGWQRSLEWISEQPWARYWIQSSDRRLRSIQVFLGPYPDEGSADSVVEELLNKDIDHTISRREDGIQISFGYFTQQEFALVFVEHLRSQGFEASTQQEYRTLGPWFWMDVRAQVASRDRLLERDWLAEGVITREIDCSFMSEENGDQTDISGVQNRPFPVLHRAGKKV